MDRIQFDAGNPNLALLRQVILRRLREQQNWRILDCDNVAKAYQKYLELTPPRYDDHQVLEQSILEVFWQLVTEGVVAPGSTANQGGFPWFRITQYGRTVLANSEYVPHDRLGYLQLLHQRVNPTDATVVAYLSESLDTFVRGSFVASTVMLGVASERVFELLCGARAGPSIRERTEQIGRASKTDLDQGKS